MATSIGGMAIAGDGTTDVCTGQQAPRTIIALLAITEPTRSSSEIKDARANS